MTCGLTFFCTPWQHKRIIRQPYACLRGDCDAAAAYPCLHIKHAKQQHGPLPLADQRITDTHQQRHVVTEYPPLSPQTHPDADSLILSHPLITHTDALEQRDRKALCMQNRPVKYTRVRGQKQPDSAGRGVFVCDVKAFCGLWIFTKAL